MPGKKKRKGKRTAARRAARTSPNLVELLALSPQERTLLTYSALSGPRPYSLSPSTSGGMTGVGPNYSLPTEGAPLPLGPYFPAPPAPPTGPAPQAPGLPVYQAPPPSPPRSPGLNPSTPVLVR